ncbi:MAG: peptidogalycan biosysnthesis protein [Myxococcota bacterium]
MGDGSPFLEHAFLSAVLDEGCASPEHGWTPCIVTSATAGGSSAPRPRS